ncbi:MAG TPA: hypothetical protein VHG30_02130 [Microvirga sp.]|nr:hypothetical protein [Microvirga sp.]
MKNPWMSLWLSAANTWAGAARGFWTAEMARQQKAMLEGTKPSKRSPSGSRSAAPKRRSASKRPRKASR